MRSKKVFIYIAMITIFLVISYVLHDGKVYAGNINGEESRVISVASGTFTYNGKTYKAYSSYVNELYSYMSGDDIDLTAEQADRAINYIYANVASGVSSGYVYEVEQAEENNADLDDIIPELEESGELEKYQDGFGLGSGNGIDSEENAKAARDTAKEASDRQIDEMFGEIDKSQNEKEKYNNKPKATETDASVVMTDKDIIITNKDDKTVISKDERIVSEAFTTGIVVVSAAVLAIGVGMLVLLLSNGCMRFSSQERSKVKKGHHKRDKIRKICRYVFTVTGSITVSLLFFIIALVISVYDKSHISQNIQTSGYFRYAYLEYISQESRAGTGSGFLEYEDFLVEEKKALVTMDSSAYTGSVSIAPYIKRIQQDLQGSLMAAAIILTVSLILLCIVCIFMDINRDRGLGTIAISMIFGTIFILLIAAVLIMLHIEKKVFIEPDYLYYFIVEHVGWTYRIMTVVGVFGMVISMTLIGLYRNMKKKGW